MTFYDFPSFCIMCHRFPSCFIMLQSSCDFSSSSSFSIFSSCIIIFHMFHHFHGCASWSSFPDRQHAHSCSLLFMILHLSILAKVSCLTMFHDFHESLTAFLLVPGFGFVLLRQPVLYCYSVPLVGSSDILLIFVCLILHPLRSRHHCWWSCWSYNNKVEKRTLGLGLACACQHFTVQQASYTASR